MLVYRQSLLALFILLAPLLLFLWRHYRKGLHDFRLLIGPWRFEQMKDAYIFRWFFSSLLLVIYFSAMIMALSDIRFSANPVAEDVSGRDVVFCVDVSRSMNAQDTGVSRMDLAREAITGIIESGHSMRFGLVVFKGTASVFVPVTEDLYTLIDSLSYLGPGLLSSTGTNIRAGVDTAVSAFPSMQESRRQLILFTDGEALEGSMDGVGMLLKERRIEFTAVGVGTINGATIPAGADAVVTGPDGQAVVSRLDDRSLRAAAAAAGGTYRQLDQHAAVHALVTEMSAQRGQVYARERLGYRLLLLPAFIAMALLYFIWGSAWKREQ
ncbi:MAG: VWA domain-containing protein [Spirochaetales bacterium]|nr:VWA domain-containing protein [Spirochaetales bacterium]